MTDRVTIFEVGPRDGLQNEARIIPTTEKIRLIALLSETGLKKIEVASFVSPKWVPQMADSAEVMAGILRFADVRFAALVPNIKGLEGAIHAKADEIAIFASASETFSQKNINCSIDESFDRFAPVVERAKEIGLPVRGYLSCVTDCPFEGHVAPRDVAHRTEQLMALGCYEVSLGDTIGKGTADRVATMLDAVLERVPASVLAGHFHDTGGQALDNVEVAVGKGLRTFDSSVGGLGGCPYAPGAPGNLATEALLAFCTARGLVTGVDPDALAVASAFAGTLRSSD